MHNSGTTAHAWLRMAVIALGALAAASCTDALSPRDHGRDGTVVQLSPDTRAELVSASPGTLELRFVAGPARQRVQSFQGEIRFDGSRYRVLSATAGEGATASWHAVEPGRIRFAGVAADGIAGRGIVFRFEKGESFQADDFRLVVEEAVLRSDPDAAPVRFAAPAAADAVAAATSERRNAARGGTPAAQAAWEMRGDVNGDGAMDAVDALAVLSHVVEKALPATFVVQPQGDVSRDGAVTAADALLMLEYRVGRDRVVDVQITTSAGPVDVADSLVLAVEVRGVRGEPLNAAVVWSCPDAAWVRECGPRLFRPAIRAAPSPVPVRLVASAGGRADTLEASVFERPLSLLRVALSPYPGYVSSDNTLSQQSHAIRAIPGGTTAVFATASDAASRVRPREFRVSVADTTLFTARVGEPGPERTPVVVTGRRAGSGILTILTNGVSVPVRVEVAAPAALACSPANSLPLDLAPGEIRTFRGSDPGAPGCLDFRAARDRGRQYMVLTYAVPYSTGKAPQSALELFNFEGQALFYGAGEATPAAYPVFRFYTPDVNAASLTAASRGEGAARGAEPGHTWRVGGTILREGRPSRERAIRQIKRGAHGGGARLNVSGATTTSIQAGDTLVSVTFMNLDRGVRTTDGGPASDRAVVTHVGENLIIAEHLDVLRGRLIGADGRVAARIPAAEYAKIDAAYGRPKRQLDRLFGGPYGGTVAGRDGGGRELAVNMPLQQGVWGYAHGDLTTINYWSGSFDGQPSLSQTPLLLAELLLAHEFTHVRHHQQWSDRDKAVGPWMVEGFADFGSQLGYAARVLGSETPSRTGRANVGPVSPYRGQLPSLSISSSSSLFGGYDGSSFIFAYIADQVDASGGDGLRAVRDLALSGHSRVAAEQAVQRHLPGRSLTDVVARAEAARYLEFLRKQPCGWCIGGDPVPPALRIAPDLPAHTKYLQFDHPAMGQVLTFDARAWPIVRPGRSFGTAYQLRTGASWPIFIDGTDPLGDAQYHVDLSGERQTVLAVVRIR